MDFLKQRRFLAAAAGIVGLAIMFAIVLTIGGGAEPVATPSPTAAHTARTSASPSPSPSTTSPTEEPTASPTASPTARCPYDGDVQTEAALEWPVLVSIDNHPSARPATSLSLADIVFENPVQGNSTRFVALFACDGEVETIGPVRSGRWIQGDLWQQLRMLPIIYGAAPYTTAYFAELGMPYVDGNVEPWRFFSRSASRPAPYNVYLSMSTLQELLEEHPSLADRVRRAGEPRPILRFDEDWTAPEEARSVESISMSTTSTWTFGWTYDRQSSRYERIDGGRATTDAATGDALTRRTIIVQRAVSERPFADPRAGADPPIQRLVGSGTGVVYVNGIAIDVEWSRPSADDVTSWTLAGTDRELSLPPGPIWWEILPTTASLAEE